jgi:hypothetical protein
MVHEGWDEGEGLSDEDLATLDGIWKTSGGDVVDETSVTRLAAPVRPEVAVPAAAAEAPDIEAAKALLMEDDGAGVFPWRSASREQIAAQWTGLREFVDWTVVTYRFSMGSEHNPCWWRHPGIVMEWVSLRHLYDLSWSVEDAGSGPNNFHYWLQASRSRFATAWKGMQNCGPNEHQEPRALAGAPTVIEDEEWARLTGTDEVYEAPEQWPTRRERVEDEPSPAEESPERT